MGIRVKLVIALGGLVLIMAVVGMVSIHTLNETSQAIARILLKGRFGGRLRQHEDRHRQAGPPGRDAPLGEHPESQLQEKMSPSMNSRKA